MHNYRSLPYYSWPSMVIWGLERFLRLVRLVVYNFSYFNPFGSKSTKSHDATVDVLTECILRVTIHRPSYFHWRPAQSVYLSFPSVNAYPLQAHPFTIATIDDANAASSREKKLIFIFRVRDGFTKKLMRVASPGATYKAFINGPYGSPPALVGYDTVILIAG
jgi:predicted ferric reductase